MIDVMKRLAELDAKNPKVVKEDAQVQECGPMGMMGSMPSMGMDKPSVPANFSINASAASGNEVADMMSQILTLAGMKAVGGDDLGHEPHGSAMVTTDPVVTVGPVGAEPMPSASDSMRSVLDKLNPEMDDSEGGDEGGELGPFQHDDGSEEDSDIDDTGAAEVDDDNDREETDETVDSMPNDPTDAPQADANQYAHQENQPGSGQTSDGEKRQSNLPTATYEALMQQYREFIGEGKKPDFLDVDKDGDKKEPMKKAAKEKDLDEGTCPTCHKDPCGCETNESVDILRLAGLK